MKSTGKRKAKKDAVKGHRKKGCRSISESVKEIVRKIDEWVAEGLDRERRGLKVFESNNRANIVSQICGITYGKVFRIRKEENMTPKSGRPAIEIDNFAEAALSRLVLGFYKRLPPELPTLATILGESRSIPEFPVLSRTSLYRLLKKLGFVCQERSK